MLSARRSGTESWVGVMIQRITLEMMRGLRLDDDRVVRKLGIEPFKERRFMVQSGILKVAQLSKRAQESYLSCINGFYL